MSKRAWTKKGSIPSLQGRAIYHLALCECRQGDGDIEAARREAEKSLKVYGEDDELAPLNEQTEQLLADLRDNKPLPPLDKVDVAAALESARVRFRARTDLATLPLDKPAVPLLDKMLGPAKSTEEVIAALGRQYCEQGKPEVWFLPPRRTHLPAS